MSSELPQEWPDISPRREEFTRWIIGKHRREVDWKNTVRPGFERTSDLVKELIDICLEENRCRDAELTAIKFSLQVRLDTETVVGRISDIPASDNRLQAALELAEQGTGIVGGTNYTLTIQDETVEETLLESFRTLRDPDVSESALDEAAGQLLSATDEVRNAGISTFSAILFLLYPTRYPVINNRNRAPLRNYFNLDISGGIESYFENAERYRQLRDYFGFDEHLRELDWFCHWSQEESPVHKWYDRNNIDNRTVWQIDSGHADLPGETLFESWLEHDGCSVSRKAIDRGSSARDEGTAAGPQAPEIIIAKEGTELLGVGVIDGEEEDTIPVEVEQFYDATADQIDWHAVEWFVEVGADIERDTARWGGEVTLNREPVLSTTDQFETLRRELESRTGGEFTDGFTQLETYISDQQEEDSIPRNESPTVWIEKTELTGRPYKQEGELSLGNAIYSPSANTAGHQVYEELREAEVGDIVVHLLQDQSEVVGVSTIESELEEDWEGHPDFPWTDDQRAEGGYRRWLTDYLEFDTPVGIYEDILDNEEYADELTQIRNEYTRILFDKNLELLEGSYFTRCPDELVSIFARELGAEFTTYLESRNYIVESNNGTKSYFWLNTGEEDWQREGDEMFFIATSKSGADRRNRSGFEQAAPGDKILVYQMAPKQQVVGRARVTEGLHEEYSESRDETVEGITVEWVESIDGPEWDAVVADPELSDCTVVTSDNAYYLTDLTKAEYDRILGLEPQPRYRDFASELAAPTDEITISRDTLYFPNNEWERLRARIRQALDDGNHVLFFGPPGTGKTKLAREVCEDRVGTNGYQLVTASADWSTFDTVGGYQTTAANRLEFEPGVVLKRFQDENDSSPSNEWLVIDELNRADIDKAFGSLFSALTGESVTLPYDGSDGDPIEILDASREDELVGQNRYFIPEDWRMLATMNTLDKTSLYEMSYAFMRRWAFIPVGIPDLPEPADEPETGSSDLADLVGSYVDIWAANGAVPQTPAHYDTVGRIWFAVNQQRAIGPAIVEDIYQYVAHEPSPEAADYVSPLIMYVFPQLEGLRRGDIEQLLARLEEIIADESGELWTVARDFFQMDLAPESEG